MTSVELYGELTVENLLGFVRCFPGVQCFTYRAYTAPTAELVNLIASYRNLKQLTVSIDDIVIDDTDLTTIACACRCLTHVTLEHWPTSLEGCVAALCDHCPHLDALSLRYSDKFKSTVLDTSGNI